MIRRIAKINFRNALDYVRDIIDLIWRRIEKAHTFALIIVLLLLYDVKSELKRRTKIHVG